MTNIISTARLICIYSLMLTCFVFVQESCKRTDSDTINDIRNFISANWDGSIEYNPTDHNDLIGLPKPYSVPTIHGEKTFKELYYWGTYFTNAGLLKDGRTDQARNNVEDIIYMVNKFGKMLNGSQYIYLNRSQPPFLSMMVFDIYRSTKDKKWLQSVVGGIEKEYEFWMTRRITPCGLNRYSNEASDDEKIGMAHYLKERFNNPLMLEGLTHAEIVRLGSHFVAEAESGWDFNPRFDNRCEDFCPIDLNAYLYMYETNFAYFYKELGKETDVIKWESAAETRKKLINKYCYDSKSGLFFDYDYLNGRHSQVISSALFSLMFAELTTPKQSRAIVETLPLLETEYGLRACQEKTYNMQYQWGATNGWPPLHFIAVEGLNKYGYRKEANRIKRKFINLVVDNFHTTHNLWERYNVLDGSINTSNEYAMPAFMGWTAGTFICFTE